MIKLDITILTLHEDLQLKLLGFTQRLASHLLATLVINDSCKFWFNVCMYAHHYEHGKNFPEDKKIASLCSVHIWGSVVRDRATLGIQVSNFRG